MRSMLTALKQLGLMLAVTGAMMYAGGCSIRSIGAALLSEYLTTGGSSTLASDLTSGLGSLFDQATDETEGTPS